MPAAPTAARLPAGRPGDDNWSDGELDFAPLPALEAKLFLGCLGAAPRRRADRQGQHCRRAGGRRSRPVRQRRRALWRQGIGPPGPQRLAPGSGLAGRNSAPRTSRARRCSAAGFGLDALTGTTSLTLSLAGVGRGGRSARSSRPCAARRSSAWSMARCATLDLLKMLRDVKKDILAGWQPLHLPDRVPRAVGSLRIGGRDCNQPRSAAGCPGN